jgi:arylsulfatase A-like enzyme
MVLSAGGLVAALAVAFVLLVRAPRAPPQPRLVVLYAPCAVNRNFLAPYHRAVAYTPHLAAFAHDGLVFTKHQTEEGLSGIAYAALLSGTQAMRHGVYSHPTPLDDGLYLISEAFRDGGYDVFLWADQDMASPALNYGQGVDPTHTFWEKHRMHARETQSGAILRGEDPQLRRVLATLRDNPNAKAFLLTMFTVTHQPYGDRHVGEFCGEFPNECAGLSDEDIRTSAALFWQHSVGMVYAFDDPVASLGLSAEQVSQLIRVAELLYKSNVYFLDQLFGSLLAAIEEYGLLDESLIVFTADHGELMYRQNAPFHWTHGFMLAPEDIIVPLIMRGPGVPSGRYDAVTRSIDVFPTLAGLAGLRLPRDVVMGVDLSAAMRGESPPPELTAFSHTGLLPKTEAGTWVPWMTTRLPPTMNTPP